MKTSMSEVTVIDAYLNDRLRRQEMRVLHPALGLSAIVREKVCSILHHYHRKKLKKEVEDVHLKIFNDQSAAKLKNTVMDLFKPERP